MKRFSEQLKKKADTVKLRAVEKRELHDRIVAFMEYHPLPSTMAQPAVARNKQVFEPYRLIAIPQSYLKAFAGAAALIIIVAIPAAAENSVPGDILYPVKVNVTEEVRSTLSFNSYEKVVWETTRLERRISEARQLAQAGKLTPEVEAGVLAAVQTHKVEAEKQIESMRTTDADGAVLAQMTFATMLDVQASVLKADDSASTTAGMSTVALASALDATYTEVTAGASNDMLSNERLMAQLEVETTRSYELLESIKGSATEQEQNDVRRRLSDVENKIKVVMDSQSTDAGVAQTELKNAWTDLQKLISFMTDIDVRSSLAIETLVPVVMTSEEKLALTLQHYAKAQANVLRLENGVDSVSNADISDKISQTIPQVRLLLDSASSTIYTAVDEAKVSTDEALALTESMLALASFPDVVEGEVVVDNATSTATSTEDIEEDQEDEATTTAEVAE